MKLRRKWKALIIVLAMLGAGTLVYFLVIDMDTRELRDYGLEVNRPDAPDEENGVVCLADAVRIERGFGLGDDCRLAWRKAVEGDDPATLLTPLRDKGDDLRALFESFDRAMECRYFVLPVFDDVAAEERFYPDMGIWRAIAYIQATRALITAGRVDRTRGADQALDVVELGSKIQRAGGPTILLIFGAQVKSIGLDTLRHIVLSGHVDVQKLRELEHRLASLEDTTEAVAQSLAAEYQMLSGTIDRINEGSMDWVGHIAPNKTKNMIADECRRLIEQADKPWSEVSFIAAHPYADCCINGDDLLWRLEMRLTPNGGGRLFHGLYLSFSHVLNWNTKDKTNVSMARTVIALKRFKQETGDYPDTLDALVPEYLPALPIDYYDGKPIRYSRDSLIVYSVGWRCEDLGESQHWDEEFGVGVVDWGASNPSTRLESRSE